MCNMERIRLTASEEMSFENVDGRQTDGRTTDGRRMPVYTISSPVNFKILGQVISEKSLTEISIFIALE